MTEADLLDVLRRNFEDHWIEGLLDDPSSRSIFVGMAAVMLRCQSAIDENLYRGAYILTAPGRAPATSTIRLFRTGGGAAGTIDVDVRILDEVGVVWRPSAAFAVPFAGIDQTIDLPITTDRVGHWLNSFEPPTFRLLDPVFDPAFEVIAGIDPAEDGRSPVLEQHGDERGRPRATGETAAQYRLRLRFLEDQVSPRALAEGVREILDGHDATKFLALLISLSGYRPVEETFREHAQPSQEGLTGRDGLFADDAITVGGVSALRGFFDDPSGGTLRDYTDALAWFDVRIPWFASLDETRLFYDDGFLDDPDYGYADAPADDSIVAPVTALVGELDERRPHCVLGRILFGEDVVMARHPGDWGGIDFSWVTTLWLTGGEDAPTDRLLAVRRFDADAAYIVSTTGQGAGAVVAAGDQVYEFTVALPTTPASISRVVLRAMVGRRDVGAGTDPELTFILEPATAGAPVRLLGLGSSHGTLPVLVSDLFGSGPYQPVELILEENPIAAAPWAPADLVTLRWGVANVAAVGPTEEMRISELVIEIHARYL